MARRAEQNLAARDAEDQLQIALAVQQLNHVARSLQL
jgi:hypothetical protein